MPKEYFDRSEKVRKTSGDLDDTKKSFVATTGMFFKEGNNNMVDKKSKTKPNLVKEDITLPISSKKKIDAVNKTEKSQASNKKLDTPKSNKLTKINQ